MTARSNHNVQHISQTGRKSSGDKTNSTARFWDRIADRYAAKSVANEEAYARKLAVTRNYLNVDSEVLELGCGTGSTALVHAPYVKHIRATDISSRMIEIASNKAAEAEVDNVEFVTCAADNAGVLNAKYDAILALSLLHLLPKWSDTIDATHRMLKPGGVLVTSTICMNDGYKWLRLIAPIARSGADLADLWRWA